MSGLNFGFIGLGLIGGSIAKALKKAYSTCNIIAYDINQEALAKAKADFVVNICADSIDNTFSICDYIFLCAPVKKNDENLLKIKEYMSPTCILTDVGSVKNTIHQAIIAADLEDKFIGGHPMAGSERVGYDNSKAILVENAYYILTPTDKVAQEKINEFHEIIKNIGAIPILIEPATHDYITAGISHIPHIIAASLVNLVHDSDSEDGIMKLVAAGGFKDITRIASSSPVMWQNICLTNTENIKQLLDSYIESLNKIKGYLEEKDADKLYELFDSAREYRDSFISTSSGPIKKRHSFNVDIADENGALASITVLLASNSISIKNIGILHNRELVNGVLNIEFYDEEQCLKAQEILTNKNYIIHPY